MAAIITNRLRIFNAQQFIESLSEQTPLWEGGVSYSEGDVVLYQSNLYIAVEAGTSEVSLPPTHTTGVSAGGSVLRWAFYNVSLYNNLYLGIGKNTAWADDSNPPTPSDSVKEHYTVKNDLIAMKKVGDDTITLALPRIDWETGSVYTMYDDQDPEEIIPNGYVLTEGNNQYNVYKCINNSKWTDTSVGVAPVASTVKPTGTSTSLLETGDGYVWKYMYSVQLDRALKFLTKDYFPVKYLTAEPSDTTSADYTQYQVQQSAKSSSGAIDFVKIVDDGDGSGHAGGRGYLQNLNHSGVTIGESTTSFSFTPTASDMISRATDAGNGGYDDYAVVFISGNTSYQQSISSFSFSAGQVDITLDGAFPGLTGSQAGDIIIAPEVQLAGDGTGAAAYGLTQGDEIAKVVISNGGSGYTYATATVLPALSSGTECQVRAIMSPGDGHGCNPVEELGGYYAMVALKLEYDEQDTRGGNTESVFPVVSDSLSGFDPVFRQIIILSDPIDTSTSKIAYNTTYRGPAHPEYDDGNSEFNVNAGTGKVLYIENRQPVSRAVDQIEDIKVVFEF